MLSRRSFHSLATTAWKIAATQTASSTRVQTSQTRNSSVGYAWCGRTSHQIFEPSGMQFVRTSASSSSPYSLYERMTGGIPVRGKFLKTTPRYDFSPVWRPIQNGELVDRQSTCGTK